MNVSLDTQRVTSEMSLYKQLNDNQTQ